MPEAHDRYGLLKGAFKELKGASRWDVTLSMAVDFVNKLGLDGNIDIKQTAVLPQEVRETAVFYIGDTGYGLLVESDNELIEEDKTILAMFASLLANAPLFQTRRTSLTYNDEVQVSKRLQRIIAPLRELRPQDELLDAISQSLHAYFEASISYIALYEPTEQRVTFPRFFHNREPITLAPISILDENSVVCWTISNNCPYFSDNWKEEKIPAQGLTAGLPHSKSVLIIPITFRQQVLGAISVQRHEEGAYKPHHFTLLKMIAAELGILFQNTRIYEESRKLVSKSSTDYLTAVALRQAIAVIGTSLDQEAVLNNLLMSIAGVMVFDVGLAYLLDGETLRLSAGYDFYDRQIPILFNDADLNWAEVPLFDEIIRHRSLLVVNDAQSDWRWREFVGSENFHSILAIPLIVGNRMLGIVTIFSNEAGRFDKREVWLASTLANHGSIALQNALNMYETEQQLAELSTLYQATATMSANLDQDFVLQSVAEEMIRALRVDTCTIFVWDSVRQTLVPAVHRNQVYPEERPLSGDDPIQVFGLSRIDNLSSYSVVQHTFRQQEAYTVRRDSAVTPEQIELLDASGLQSVLLLPLVQRNDVLGLLALGQVYNLRTIEQSSLRLAQNLAGQAAVAIDHARLFSQARRRVSELSTFHDIVLHLNTPLNLNAVLHTITESALKLVDANNLHIYLYNAKTDHLTLGAALWRNGDRKAAVSSPRKNGITFQVVKSGKPVVINHALEHPLWQSEDARQWGIHAIAGFPITQGKEVIGAFTATYKTPHTFTEDELLLLNMLSDHAAVAVKNARLFEDTDRRFREMSALVDLAKQVTSSLSLQEVLQTTVDTMRKLLDARASTITMIDDEQSELILMAGSGVDREYINTVRLQLGEGVSGTVVSRGEPIYISDTHHVPDFLSFSDQVRSLLVVPLTHRDEVIGTMTIDSDQPDAFAKSSIQLMTVAALQVSVAIANARMFEDIQKAAGDLALAYEELKENDRMKEELVQNLSHELRTPLTFVKGYVDLLMEGEMGLLSEEQQNVLSIVTMKTNEITHLIDDIVTLQRIDAANLELEQVRLSKLIQDTIHSYALIAEERSLHIKFSCEREELDIMLDKDRIIQVLNNLLTNAIKFSPNGGEIEILLKDFAEEVEVTISDEGIGLPKEKIGRIFERFYQVDGSVRRKYGGTGLGLAIVKRIIDAHGGRIWAESRLNIGSAFTFRLPRQ